ncbi:MAG: hypothetical protein ABL982_05965 [Vicinamibacterales bacterium]
MRSTTFWPVGLLSSAFQADVNRQSVAMAICVGYFVADEAGAGYGDITVAGYVSSKARWRQFDERWPRELQREQLTAVDGAQFLDAAGERASGWLNDPQRQIRVVRSLRRVADQHGLRAFACSLRQADFDAVNSEYRFAESASGPYGVCAACLIARIQQWMGEHHPDDLTLFVFEEGDVHHREILRVRGALGVDKGEPPQLWPRSWVDERGRTRRLRPFEACDLLVLPSPPPTHDLERISRTRLLEICQTMSIPRRASQADDRACFSATTSPDRAGTVFVR